MKKSILYTSILTTMLLGAIAQAEIPSEFHKTAGGNPCSRQQVESQNSNGVIEVVDGLRCHTLYSDLQLVEVVIENLAYHKQIYIYDRNEMYEFERSLTIRIVKDRTTFDFQDGAALYLGKTNNGRDRFLVSLVSVFHSTPAAPLDIYVKMGGRQYQTTSVNLKP